MNGFRSKHLARLAIVTVTFASPTVAYAYGGRGDTPGLVLRSDDAGRTWRDLSNRLPTDYPQVFDAAFSDDRTGDLVGRGYFTDPAVIRTNDGGATWHAVELPPSSGFPLFGDGDAWEPASVTDTLAGTMVNDVLRLRDDDALAVVRALTNEDVITHVLGSVDGGHSWHHEPTAFERGWDVHDLARNTDRD